MCSSLLKWFLLTGLSGKFSAAVASLALAFCRGCGSDINTDDILVILVRQLTPGMALRSSLRPRTDPSAD